ncbi:MAG: dTDP-glucose 4,6-dehydratase [Candidatus Absconditabacterales bacterium]
MKILAKSGSKNDFGYIFSIVNLQNKSIFVLFYFIIIFMKKIIITGGAGFIGSNFLNKYVTLYTDITFINVDCLTYAGKLENISEKVKSAHNYIFEKIDIRDTLELEEIFKRHAPTDVINFAAESHVDNSIKNPKIFTETNIIGTQNLLDLYRKYGLQRFHQISTDEVYGDIPNSGFFLETTPLNPSSPYSASKTAADMLVKAYGRTFNINYTITRCSNNYGPNQDNEKLIPHFIHLLQENKPVTVYGDGSNIRDWLFVEDHCDAVREVFTKAESGSIYNIGGNNEYSNLEITKILLNEMGKNESYISFVTDRPGHDKRYAIDASKIKNELGWEPKIKFDEGIKTTIQFYLSK